MIKLYTKHNYNQIRKLKMNTRMITHTMNNNNSSNQDANLNNNLVPRNMICYGEEEGNFDDLNDNDYIFEEDSDDDTEFISDYLNHSDYDPDDEVYNDIDDYDVYDLSFLNKNLDENGNVMFKAEIEHDDEDKYINKDIINICNRRFENDKIF